MQLQTKTVEFKATSVNEDGTFEGYASVFGNKDRGDDIVHAGAFAKSIQRQGSKRPILADHKYDLANRLGIADLSEDSRGLAVKGHLNLEKQVGRDVYADLKQAEEHDVPLGMSFGYNVPKGGAHFKDGVRHLTELDVHEVTITQFPMNPEAGVTDVKAETEEGAEQKAIGHDYGTTSFDEAYAQSEVWRRRYSMMDAFDEAVYNTLWATSLSDQEQLDLLIENADAFNAAFKQWARDLVAAMGSDQMKASAETREAADRQFRASVKAAIAGLPSAATASGATTQSEKGSDGPLSLASLAEESKGLFSFLNTPA